MSKRSARLRVHDIIEASGKILEYTSGMSFDDFADDGLRIDAVLRNFEVIGEAARCIPSDVISAYPNVPWAQMRGMRNLISHEYFRLHLPVIWRSVTVDIPALIESLRPILAALPEDR